MRKRHTSEPARSLGRGNEPHAAPGAWGRRSPRWAYVASECVRCGTVHPPSGETPSNRIGDGDAARKYGNVGLDTGLNLPYNCYHEVWSVQWLPS